MKVYKLQIAEKDRYRKNSLYKRTFDIKARTRKSAIHLAKRRLGMFYEIVSAELTSFYGDVVAKWGNTDVKHITR